MSAKSCKHFVDCRKMISGPGPTTYLPEWLDQQLIYRSDWTNNISTGVTGPTTYLPESLDQPIYHRTNQVRTGLSKASLMLLIIWAHKDNHYWSGYYYYYWSVTSWPGQNNTRCFMSPRTKLRHHKRRVSRETVIIRRVNRRMTVRALGWASSVLFREESN
jgi:hypothetical protein